MKWMTAIVFGSVLQTCVSASGPVSLTPAQLETIMQPIVNEKSEQYNCTISAALSFSTGTKAAVVAGNKDLVKKVPAVLSDKYVWGSVTKTLTGSNILKAVEAGLLTLNDPAHVHVDPVLTAIAEKDPTMKFSNMTELFGPDAVHVTINQLARMMSGVPDFDTADAEKMDPTDKFRKSCYEDPTKDYRPQDLLSLPWVATKNLTFTPGTKVEYSSTNFVLLGLVLAGVYESTWDKFNQGAIIPAANKKHTVFGISGNPLHYTGVHGYDRTNYNGNDPHAFPGIDTASVDCVYAGWSASDYTATIQDAADLTLDIYGPWLMVLCLFSCLFESDRTFSEHDCRSEQSYFDCRVAEDHGSRAQGTEANCCCSW